MKARHTLADVFHTFGDEYVKNNHTSFEQQNVMRSIQDCRTEQLGGHWKACKNCGDLERHYNSCGNRHCPSCQGVNKERWILERSYDLLPVKYYHVVFTVPAELRNLFYQNQKILYDLLFKCAWETLKDFAADERQGMQAEPGAISILHTWSQKLLYHPHIHMIVPEGGIDKQSKWKTSKGNDKFLFYVPNMASKFRGKFLDNLYKLFLSDKLKLSGELKAISSTSKFYEFKDKLYAKNWVIDCKAAFKSPGSVLEYLGRYTHKIAISNYRIQDINLNSKEVTFSYLDRTDKNKKKSMTLPADKFIRRFLTHVLPKGYRRIRHHGFLSCRVKKVKIQMIRESLDAPAIERALKRLSVREIMMLTKDVDPLLCKTCKNGLMLAFESIPKIRGKPVNACELA